MFALTPYVSRFTFHVSRFTFHVSRFRSGRTMRIGIDAHMVGSRETGNETYCMGLIEGLEQIEDHNQYMVYLSSPSVLPSVNGHGRLLRRMLRRGSSARRLLMGFAQASRSDHLDVLHVT